MGISPRKSFSKSVTAYYPNGNTCFNMDLLKICGNIEMNPGARRTNVKLAVKKMVNNNVEKCHN